MSKAIPFSFLLFLILSCHRKIQFVEASTQLQKVLHGEIEESELGFYYGKSLYLDTSFYRIIVQFEGFEAEFYPPESLPHYAAIPFDTTIVLEEGYLSVEEAIASGKRLFKTINPVKEEVYEPVPLAGKRAILSIGNSWYLTELVHPDSMGIVRVEYAFLDGFPAKVMRKWEREERRRVRKASKTR